MDLPTGPVNSPLFPFQAQTLFSGATVDSDEVTGLLEDLTVATAVESEEAPSLFPSDLQMTNNILNMTVEYLLEDLAANPSNPIPFSAVCTFQSLFVLS